MVNRALHTLTAWFTLAVHFLRGLFGLTANFLHQSLSLVGVPAGLQTLVILVADIALIVAVLRVFGGVVRALLLVFLVLLIVHMLAPPIGV